MIKIIAHRGYTVTYPENTLSAFLAASDAGADAIELDVHQTKDGQLVVHHDYYLGDPDNGRGVLRGADFAYIQSLNINKTEHIPTLGEVFGSIGAALHYEIELKGSTEAFLQKVVTLAKTHCVLNNIEFTSPHPYALTKIKELEPAVKVGMFVPPLPGWMDRKLGQTHAIHGAVLGHIDVVHCAVGLLDKQFVANAHEAGLLVHAADCDTAQSLKLALEAGADQLSTSNLALALAKIR